jgi:hypothetical protein
MQNRACELELPPRPDGLLSLLVEQVPVALAIFDTTLRYLAVSPRHLFDITWLTSGETFASADVIGRSLYETFPNFPACWREINSRALAGGKLAVREDLVRRQDRCRRGPHLWLADRPQDWNNTKRVHVGRIPARR